MIGVFFCFYICICFFLFCDVDVFNFLNESPEKTLEPVHGYITSLDVIFRLYIYIYIYCLCACLFLKEIDSHLLYMIFPFSFN